MDNSEVVNSPFGTPQVLPGVSPGHLDLNTSSGVSADVTIDLAAQNTSADGSVAEHPANFPVEIRQLVESSQKLQAFISSKPSLTMDQTPDVEGTLAALKRSSNAFLALTSHMMAINEAGKPSETRSLSTGSAMIPVAVNAIQQRVSQQSNQPSSSERRMSRAFARAHRAEIMANGNRLPLPEWYAVAKVALEPAGSNGEMPGPEVYLQNSRRAAGVEDAAIEKAAWLREEMSRMRNSRKDGEGIGGDKLEEAQEAYQKLIIRLDSTLERVDDADPAAIELCCRNVRLEFKLKPEVLMLMIELHNALGQTLERLTLGTEQAKELKGIPAPEFLGETDIDAGGRAVKRLQPVILNAAPLLAEEQKTAITEAVFVEYAGLHAALMEIYEERGKYGRDETRKKTLDALENAVTGLLGENREKGRQIILKIAATKTEPVKAALAALLCSKELAPGPGRDKEPTAVLSKLENIELLGEALSLLITADDNTASTMARKLEGAMLRSIVETALKVRQNLKAGNYVSLARFFDTELKTLTSEEQRSLKRPAILHCLLVAATDSTARLYLKALLKNLELVDQVAGSILSSVVGETSPVSRFVESLRARISRRFSSDLSEYWGQVKMVQQWQSRLAKHLKILGNPGAWAGIEPNQVFYNGYLLHGYPGAGKTFLVTCMANELELPLVIISRKEMSAALKKKRQDNEKNGKGEEFNEEEFQARFAEFMENKITQAREVMHKSGTKACMVFMDEMEAEFLKRDPATCSHEEFTRTNIMLTEVEKAIKKHPEIIFVGATNHIDLVDPAALRKGRFGVHYEIKLPGKEDVIEVLEGSLKKLGLQGVKDLPLKGAFNELVETCIGMTPLSIQLAVDNTVVLERIDRDSHIIEVNEELLNKIKDEALESRTLNYNSEKEKQ